MRFQLSALILFSASLLCAEEAKPQAVKPEVDARRAYDVLAFGCWLLAVGWSVKEEGGELSITTQQPIANSQ